MPSLMYNAGKRRLIAGAPGGVNYITDAVKAMLVTGAYVPDADHEFVTSASAARVAGTTDQLLSAKVVGLDLVGDFAYLDAADPTFVAVPAGADAEGVVVYVDTGTPGTSPLLCYLDIPTATPSGVDITIQLAAPANGGLARLG